MEAEDYRHGSHAWHQTHEYERAGADFCDEYRLYDAEKAGQGAHDKLHSEIYHDRLIQGVDLRLFKQYLPNKWAHAEPIKVTWFEEEGAR